MVDNIIANGNILWQRLVKTSGQGQSEVGIKTKDGLSITIPEDQIITISCKTISGTGTVSCIFRIREEW